MESYYFIDSIIPQKRTRELVKIMIPVLVRWAKMELGNMTYNNMNHVLGYSHFSGIGYPLGKVQDVIDALSRETGEKIPSLNALCSNSSTGLPSFGYSYVYPNYEIMNKEEKINLVQGERYKAFKYEKWDWVLSELGLKPAPLFTDVELEKIVKSHKFGSGGESPEHKALKEYIAAYPKTVGIEKINKAETEKVLLSGDKLDVWVEVKDGSQWAIEVKPSTSPEQDILRGIFQCVKYKAVMSAQRSLVCRGYDIHMVLVLASSMPERLITTAKELGVTFIDCFKME